MDTRRAIAIWGSCVSRDAFDDGRSDDQLRRFDLRYYAARTSWVSQASAAWPSLDDIESPHGPGSFARRTMEEDLGKSVIDRLVALQPEVLLLDLVDERLPLYRRGATWVTQSEYVQAASLWESLADDYDDVSAMTSARRLQLFAVAAVALAQRLVTRLPNTVFVLNEAPYATRVAGGTFLPEPSRGWALDLDLAQQPMFEVLHEVFGKRLVRAVPPPSVALIDPNHRWGLTSYHYIDDYYTWLLGAVLEADTGGLREPWDPDLAVIAALTADRSDVDRAAAGSAAVDGAAVDGAAVDAAAADRLAAGEGRRGNGGAGGVGGVRKIRSLLNRTRPRPRDPGSR